MPLFLKLFNVPYIKEYYDYVSLLVVIAFLFVLGVLIFYFLKFIEPIWSKFFCNDSTKMLKIIEDKFNKVAYDYLFNESEANEVMELLKADLNDHKEMYALIKDEYKLRDMYAAKNREKFAYEWLGKHADTVIERRPAICLP